MALAAFNNHFDPKMWILVLLTALCAAGFVATLAALRRRQLMEIASSFLVTAGFATLINWEVSPSAGSQSLFSLRSAGLAMLGLGLLGALCIKKEKTPQGNEGTDREI